MSSSGINTAPFTPVAVVSSAQDTAAHEAFARGDQDLSRQFHEKRNRRKRRKRKQKKDIESGEKTEAAMPSDDSSQHYPLDGSDNDDHGDHHTEGHTVVGELIKGIVFGGLDGIITTFAIVAAAVASHLTYGEVLIVGFANLVGDAFAMGLGDFFSTRAEEDSARAKKKKYLWECEKHPAKQMKVMQQIYEEKGFSEEDAAEIVQYLAYNKHAFAEIMLLEIDGEAAEESSLSTSVKSGFMTFVSFMIFGSVPLLPYIFGPDKNNAKAHALDIFFYIAVGGTLAALFLLGALKNILVRKAWWMGGIMYVIQGGVTTALAYGVGYLFEMLVDLS